MTLANCIEGKSAREADASPEAETLAWVGTAARSLAEVFFTEFVAACDPTSFRGATFDLRSAVIATGDRPSSAMCSTAATGLEPAGARATISIRLSFDAWAAHTNTPARGTDMAPASIPTRSIFGCCAFSMRIRSANPPECATAKGLRGKCPGITTGPATGCDRCSSYCARSTGSDRTSLALLMRLAALAGKPLTPMSG